MLKQMSFRAKITLSLTIVFVVFSVLIVVFQYDRELDFKKQQLETSLNNVSELTNNYLVSMKLKPDSDYSYLDSLMAIVPVENVRVTVIGPKGAVLYDSDVENYQGMENHLHRPEVQSSIANGFGANIRESNTTGKSYYYYSRYYSDYFISTAALYDIEIRDFLKAEQLFFVYLVGLFVVIWLVLFLITKRFGDTLSKLKDFALKLSLGKDFMEAPTFYEDELGIISQQIINSYHELKRARNEIAVEKRKLHSHLNSLNEGIAFFTPDKVKILTNNRFIQYLNLIADESTISADKIFNVKELVPIVKFIDKKLKKREALDPDNLPQMEINIIVDERYYNIQCIFFQDFSFEIQIKDTSKLAKRSLLKQQLTSNIAHELKTPITGVLGYLETLNSHDVEHEQQKVFIERALGQAYRLSELIEDVSTLNKIEETKEHFTFETLNLTQVLGGVREDMKMRLEENNSSVQCDVPDEVLVNGNKSLLASIFYNLFDNAVKYGGKDNVIRFAKYLEDDDLYYFSFANTGNPIEDKHLSRIFERFYRVDANRSRQTGGTGLGLAIVKNAIQLHGGEISARNLKEGGVEFLFTLGK